MLIRLAIDKYFKTKETKSLSQAVEWCFERHYFPYLEKFDSLTFRREVLYFEEIDVLYTRLESALQDVYKLFCAKFATPGRTSHMSMEEFVELLR